KRFHRRSKTIKVDKLEQLFANRLFELVGSNSHIVDVPCGNGRFFNIFSKAEKLTMVDYSLNMLNACREIRAIKENVQLLRAEISRLPLPDKSIDLVFCMRLFHHMKNDQVRIGALKELSRVSKRYVALSFYNKNSVKYFWRKTMRKKIRGNYVPLDHILKLANQTGLQYVEHFPKRNLLEQQCLLLLKKN
ncbi:class I SAM-dependent methyltransferase, partial [Candidatus Pacearchaeota archaeon]|nr:class I SAM-dependent methyltransferase [Candidatus Pacearchaeota archaeon]